MTFVSADRVKETSTTIGTGDISLSGSAVFGYRNFSTVLVPGDTFYYCIQGQSSSDWEVGLGTYAINNAFSRTIVFSSSNANSIVSFGVGTKIVFITLAAAYFADMINVRNFGAVGDGVADDTAAFAAMSAAVATKSAVIPPGTYKITSNLTLSPLIIFERGAILNIATGVTVAFSAGLNADIYRIFNCAGTGKVTINNQYTSIGYPEWWGAISNDTGTDCAPAINACIVACPVTYLQEAVYQTASTILHQTAGRSVIGAMNGNVAGNSQGSTIQIGSGTATIYKIGPDSYTGTMQSNNVLRYVSLQRSVSLATQSGCSGLLIQFTVWTDIDRVFTTQNQYGFQIRGTSNTHMNFCVTNRTAASVGTGTDQYYGFYLNADTNIGLAGGNASLYLDQCVVGNGITWTSALDYQGLVATGTYGYSDLFINKFETSQMGQGITLVGTGNTSGTIDYKNEDVQITNCILDTCNIAGIELYNTSLYGVVQITGGYIATNTSNTSFYGIYYSNNKGAISVSQVEILLGVNSGSGIYAVYTDGTNKGITHTNNIAYECSSSNGVYYLSNVSNSYFADQIRNYSVTNGNAAITITNSSSRNVFQMTVAGKASAFSVGYYAVTTNTTYNEYRCSGIDPVCLSNPTYKMDYNATAITTATIFGTGNLTQGIMN
jgi:hypothetical protein